MAEIRDHAFDTGTGAQDTVQENQRERPTGTAQYLVADRVGTLVEDTGIMAEAAVCEGAMVQTPTPPRRRAENSGRRSELLERR